MSSTIAATESAVTYRSIRVDNLDIFYRESGSKDSPTILLLHGLPSSSRMFQPLAGHFAMDLKAGEIIQLIETFMKELSGVRSEK